MEIFGLFVLSRRRCNALCLVSMAVISAEIGVKQKAERATVAGLASAENEVLGFARRPAHFG